MGTINKSYTPKKLVLNLNHSSVQVEFGSEFMIQIYEGQSNHVFDVYDDENVLVLTENGEGDFKLNVFLPDPIESFVIDSEDSNIYAHGVDIDCFEVNLVSGNFEVDKCRIKELYVNNETGEIIIQSISDIEKVALNEDSGDIDIYSKGSIKKMLINSDIGDVDIDVTGEFLYYMINTNDSGIFLKTREVKAIDLEGNTEFGEMVNKLDVVPGACKVMVHSITGDIEIRND